MLKIRKKLAEKKEASKGIAKAGFTLIELLVVIAILAILVLLAAPRFLGYTKDANVRAMQADAKVLANSALIYNVENEGWPTGETVDVSVNGETELELAAFDKEAIDKHVQTLKGKLTDYALVTKTSGDFQEGDVLYVADKDGDDASDGVEDKDGNKHFGVNVSDETPVTPEGD